MLLEQNVINELEEEVDKQYAYLALILLGALMLTDREKGILGPSLLAIASLPIIERIYMATRKSPGNSLQSRSLRQGRAELREVINSSRDDAKKRIKAVILSVNDQVQKDLLIGTAKPNSAYVTPLLENINNSLANLSTNVVRSVTVALTNLINSIVSEEAVNVAGAIGEEPLVYKVVNNDERLCQWCARFYRNQDGSPRIYKLKDLIANGSNDGKPKSEWRAVVGSTHPRCRCELHFVTKS